MTPHRSPPSVRALSRAMLFLAALALGACTNANRFGTGSDGSSAASGAGVQATAGPNSPAYFRETVGDRVLFEVDQHTLTDIARNTLAAQARWLSDNPDFAAVIEGHADEQGTREYNLALSARRANSVQEYLIAQGVAGTRLQTRPLGKERPIAVCSEESCYQQNRRAVTLLEAGAGAGF